MALHQACYFGDVDEVSRLLPDPSDQVLALIQSPGLVFVPSPPLVVSGETFLRKGTPAQLAVQAGHFGCANLALGVLLYRHLNLLGRHFRYETTARDTDNRLQSLLEIIGKNYLQILRQFCQLPRPTIPDEFYTLLAACLLGDHNIVRKVVHAPELQQRWLDTGSNLDLQQLTTCVAALSGNRKCLQALLQPCKGRLLSPTIVNQAWLCVMKLLWPWNLPQLLSCLRILNASGAVVKLKSTVRLFPSFVTISSNWMAKRPELVREMKLLQKDLPSSEEVSDMVDSVIEYAFDMIAGTLTEFEISKTIEATLACSNVVTEDRVLQSLERLLVLFFSHPDITPVLGCYGCPPMLETLQDEGQGRLVEVVLQYMVVCQKWRMCLDKDCQCPMCHPVINFLWNLGPLYPSLQTGDILGVICYYLSVKDRYWIQDVIKNGIEPSTLCWDHKFMPHFHHPTFLNSGVAEVPRMLRPVLEIPVMPSLFQASLGAVLRSLGGDARRLDSLKMPRPLHGCFRLKGFLKTLK